MAERVPLVAAPRTVLGKKVNQLRRQGRLPGNVYGKGIPSTAVDLDARDFGRTLKAHGVRSMFELRIDGESEVRHVVLRGIERAGGTGSPTHVDFYQVDLNRPIQSHVPLHLIGESPAVRDLAGTIVQSLDGVAVRSLPLAIPDTLDVDAGLLTRFDVSITVADIKAPPGVEILTDPAVVVATVAPPRIRLEAGEEEAEGEPTPEES